MKKNFFAAVAMIALGAVNANGQLKIKTEAGDLSLTFKGRTHVDFATYFGGDKGKNADDKYIVGLKVQDTRFGFIANFDEKWTAKAEIKFDANAITYTDVYIDYKFNEKSDLQMGNFWMPFGYKIQGPQYRFVQDASVDEGMHGARKAGIAYNYNSDPLKFTAGIFSDGTYSSLNAGFNLAAKVIARPILDEHNVLHLGVAPLFTHSTGSNTFKGNAPTTIGTNTIITSDALDGNMLRYEAEAIFITGRLYTEARFLGAQVNTPGEDNYSVDGVWAQAGFLLKGDQQKYNKATGNAAHPGPKSLELLARFDHLNLNGDQKLNDITVGLNYVFNKYLISKLNWAHGKQKDAEEGYNFIHCRLQFVF